MCCLLFNRIRKKAEFLAWKQTMFAVTIFLIYLYIYYFIVSFEMLSLPLSGPLLKPAPLSGMLLKLVLTFLNTNKAYPPFPVHSDSMPTTFRSTRAACPHVPVPSYVSALYCLSFQLQHLITLFRYLQLFF